MSFERKTYIRVIKRTTTVTEVWTSTAGKSQYIKQDGKMLYDVTSQPVDEVIDEFREVTPIEQRLIDERIATIVRV
jgi:hypothetical protein